MFRRRSKKQGPRPPRAPGQTLRDEDARALTRWAAGRHGLEAYVEPETFVNEMSVVLVDAAGEFTRRPIGGPKGIDAVAKLIACPVYDVEETGYPQRMRNRIERERLLRNREKHQRRRAQFERGELPDEPPA
nr:oxidoreductase [Corynebacterium sp. c6VSa_13]